MFGRLSRGFNALVLDKEPGTDNLHIIQLEAGIKYASPHLGLFAALFYTDVTNVPFMDIRRRPDGSVTLFTNYGSSRTAGAEIEIVAEPARGFVIRTTATLQAPRYTAFRFIDPATETFLDFSGNVPSRQPKLLIDVMPSYQAGWLGVYVGFRYAGRRYSNDRNTVNLGQYTELHAGVSWTRGHWAVALTGSNLLNERALTTGNPRFDESVAVAVPGQLLSGRANPPRAATLRLFYRF
jgi:outer membrane receptor protein involved in Fe transport